MAVVACGVPDAPAQLTLDDLTATRAQIPTGLWTALDHQEQLFVAAYLIHLSQSKAAILAGYSKRTAKQMGHELMRRDRVKAAVEAAMAERIKRSEVTADAVLERVRAVAFADPNAIVSFRRSCCRYCHGTGHEYQRTPAEMRRDRAKWEAAQTKKSREEFDEAGGDGYDRRKRPHPDCPECFGDGEGQVFIADTRHLTGDAAILYAGMKETKDGVEAKLLDQGAALTNLMRHLGMLDGKPETPETADALAARIRTELDRMDASVLEAAA